ncbi:TetR/AcrR family transcriptional regulator [Nonomuraea sp. 3-1Str]|uniref:TetR/AcrR family transcriptional regulator n=1 Tax=Nonomuraea sp. 3-1Str TaxID=2929801 RepID=UPI00286617FE|nr:helix-turn-helix domain-containing protein [Nonomuraea sp. 3-1Str]MDR8411435.1 TetR/AcrR family transcriptional regulator [Nonomuraea sp. 3-1Str]
MARLSRAELQRLNRSKVVEAARREFAERGFAGATIDGIAERAGLTRGAVYSNFPGKRALYFTVLAEPAGDPSGEPAGRAGTAREALGAFARAWVTRLPLVTGGPHDPDDSGGAARLAVDLMPEILADERLRAVTAALRRLDALLLGLALERMDLLERGGSPERERAAGRRVRVAEAALVTLQGASELAAAAPGFVEPFDLVAVCEELAGLDLGDRWAPPPVFPRVLPADAPWPPGSFSEGDGVVAVLGLLEAGAVEEAVRAAPPGVPVTAVLVTDDPAELAPLARLALAGVSGCLRQAFPERAWPGLRIICDGTGAPAAAAGVPAVPDRTATAVRVRDGRIVARAHGPGACHAIASSLRPAPFVV